VVDETDRREASKLRPRSAIGPNETGFPEAHYHALYLNSLSEKTERWAHIASMFYARILQGQSTEDLWKELLS
jgi:hypothetical protein